MERKMNRKCTTTATTLAAPLAAPLAGMLAVLLAAFSLAAGCDFHHFGEESDDTSKSNAGNDAVQTYTVTFDKNGATSGEPPAALTVYPGSTIYAPNGTDLSKTGYTFAGWNTQKDGWGTTCAAGTSLSTDLSAFASATVPLYAEWCPVGMVKIPAGTFMMGQDDISNATPVHSVTITGFYMGKYEVTQAEFDAVMGQLPSSLSSSGYGEGDNYPVYFVSWYDAIAYCNKLSVSEGLTPVYTVNGITDWAGLAYDNIPTSDDNTWNAVTCNWNATGYRLPTETEWEYACRAGTTTVFNTGRNTIATSEANFAPYDDGSCADPNGTYVKRTTTVGSYAANTWGLYDMHGNVWEWCWDWYGSYSSDAQTDPVGASSGSYRVRRGGGWNNPASNQRTASRNSSVSPYNRNSIIGFRVVCP